MTCLLLRDITQMTTLYAYTFNPRSPLTWLVATWMDATEVNEEMTGAEMNPSSPPGS